jgi:adenylate kinase
MHKYIIMGVQGCGKGTQAKLMARDFDMVHISVGDIFRWNIQAHTKLAARINRLVAAGQLVPDQIVEQIISDRLEQHDWNYGFILDGFPRNHNQAQFFLESYAIDAVIHIEMSDELVMQRILSRRLCSKCGLDYNLIGHRPEVADTCDVCGGKLVQRDDDKHEAIRERLKDFHTKTQPVLELFRGQTQLVTTDGSQGVDQVQSDIRQQLSLPITVAKNDD